MFRFLKNDTLLPYLKGVLIMSNVLQNLSDQLAATVEAVGPGIVRVESRHRLSASGLVWSAEGVIVTAHHVVERDENIKVGLANGETVPATLVGRDPTTDLAVLRSEASGLTPVAQAKFDSPQAVAVGHLVLALGRPGKSVQATLGVISALSQNWRTPGGSLLDYYLQTDVVMYPGFSGGALVNTAQQVVGLNTSALLRGVSLSIPAPGISRVVDTLLTHGRIKRGYLGVSTQPVRLPSALRELLNQETGLLVAGVEPDSPAEQSGMLLGDTLVALAGVPVRQYDDLLAQLSGDRVGSNVSAQVIRGGQLTDIDLLIGERS
jgi:S1-C subfamily serine protease